MAASRDPLAPPLLFLHGLTIDGRDGAVLARALPEMHVVYPDLPGHGGAAPAPDWSPRALAEGVSAAHPARSVVVGHSWGGAIAVWLAALHPARVAALVLLDGGWFDRADLPRRAPPRDPHHAAALEALFASRSSEAWPALVAAKVPVLAVAGTKDDTGAKARLLARFHQAVPHARIESLPHVGHDLLRDAPAEVSALVATFVRAQPSLRP